MTVFVLRFIPIDEWSNEKDTINGGISITSESHSIFLDLQPGGAPDNPQLPPADSQMDVSSVYLIKSP
jgi:hypothetical protein